MGMARKSTRNLKISNTNRAQEDLPPNDLIIFHEVRMNQRQKDKYKKSPETLMKAILSLQKKLEDNADQFQREPLRVWVENSNGVEVPKPNPFVQEYRSMVRDFSAALKAYKELTDKKDEAQVSSLESIRSRFKVAK